MTIVITSLNNSRTCYYNLCILYIIILDKLYIILDNYTLYWKITLGIGES